jgi:tetratricopeptide (TPR) repeat protein
MMNEDLSFSEARDVLRKWRDDNERKSDEVVQIFEYCLADKVKKLGNEKLIILEQVFIASLDCGRIKLAEDCIRVLISEFPESLRIMKLKSMLLEALERYDDALDVLESIIKRDETNAGPRKRKVAILKAKGQIGDAIREMCDYLKKFMSDQEAWHELCNLYLMEGDYNKAAFCMEEVLLHNPYSHLIHQRLGDIRYTIGGQDNFEIAKSYYAQAIKLNGNNLRALYGLYLCCNHIALSKAQIAKRKEAQKLASWALQKISEITEKSKGKSSNLSGVSALEAAFGNLDIKTN